MNWTRIMWGRVLVALGLIVMIGGSAGRVFSDTLEGDNDALSWWMLGAIIVILGLIIRVSTLEAEIEKRGP